MDDLERLRRAATKARNDQAKARVAVAWRNLIIVEVIDRGVESQSAVCRATGLTREHIRRIVDRHRKTPDHPTPGGS